MIVVSGTERREAPERVYGSVEPSPHVPVPTTKAEAELPQETLLSIAHDLGTILGDSILMLGELSVLLIGPDKDAQPEPPMQVECLRDELDAARDVSNRIRKELVRLANRLGV